jgi:hypothetical protein
MKYDPQAYITPDNRLVIRTAEESAVYVLSPMDRDGMYIATRYA